MKNSQVVKGNTLARIEGKTIMAPVPVGPYSQAARIGETIAVAGQAGVEPLTNQLVGPDVGEQTDQAFKNIEAVLSECGATLDDVIRVDVFLSSLSEFSTMNEHYAKVFTAPYPARTTVGVELPVGMKIEITALAVRDIPRD